MQTMKYFIRNLKR